MIFKLGYIKSFLLVFIFFISPLNAQDRLTVLLDSLSIEKESHNKLELSLKVASELKFKDKLRATHYMKVAQDYAQKIDTEESWKLFYFETHNIYTELEQLDLALESLLNLYEYYKNTEDAKKYEIENYLAIIYSKSNNTNEAIRYFRKILKFYEEQEMYTLAAKTHNNIGLTYLNSNKLDSSFVYFEKGLKLISQYPDEKIEFYLKANIARCLSAMKKPLEAEVFFLEATQLLNTDAPAEVISWLNIEKANHYLEYENYSKALEFALIAKNVEPNLNSFRYSNVLRILYKAHKELKDFEKAAEYFTLYDEIRENLNIEEKAINLEKLKFQYEYKIKEQEIMIESNRRRINFLIAIAGLIITVLTLAILMTRYKNRLIKSKLENELNAYREKELKQELELKNKELTAKTIKETEQSELFNLLQNTLKEIQSKAIKTETKQALNQLANKIKSNTNYNNWEEFELRFSQVYESFYQKLNELNPNLSKNDKRICALIKLKFTTKEISHITKISVKSIENSRTRLRKKLGLTNKKIELSKFIDSL